MRKRVLLVTEGFPFGESERSFLSEESKSIAKEFDLLILAPEKRGELLYPTDGIVRIDQFHFTSFYKNRSIQAFLKVFHPDMLAEIWKIWHKKRTALSVKCIKDLMSYRFRVWQMEQKLSDIIQSERIDLVYTYWCTESALAAVYLKKRYPTLKVVTRLHGMDLYEERAEHGWQPFRKKLSDEVDGLYFACEYGRTYFIERWGVECTKKMGVFYLGSTDRGVIDFRKADKLRIVSCSNLIPLKRVDVIIEGLALLPGTMAVEWHHFGDGTERVRLERLAQNRFEKHPKIQWKFHGFVTNATLAEEYKRIAPDLFITTSSTEGGAPVSIQEAFSMGIPAVGTAVGGIPELIQEGKTGFLLPEQVIPADVAAAIVRFADLSEKRKEEMCTAARRRWTETFNAVNNAAQFTENLLELVSE